MLTGAVLYVMTKSVISISAQFNISLHCAFMIQNQISVPMSCHCYCLSGSVYYTVFRKEHPLSLSFISP